MSSTASAQPAVSFVNVEGGSVAIEDHGGSGPLLLCVPGLGDVRAEYRFLAAELGRRGYRVVTMDLRGHGESDAGFVTYTARAAADDVVTVLRHLKAERAVLVGTSFGAAAVSAAAALVPEAVERVVVIGPFVLDTPLSFGTRLMMSLLFGGPWRVSAWVRYFDSLFPTKKPADHAAHLAALKQNLKEPGRFEAARAMMTIGRKDTEPLLSGVKAPVLVVMGTKDPDFTDPAKSARSIADSYTATRVEVALVEGAGHYPHAELPEPSIHAIASFLSASR